MQAAGSAGTGDRRADDNVGSGHRLAARPRARLVATRQSAFHPRHARTARGGSGEESMARRKGPELGSLPRAVGRANGRNPISIINPCHRVIGADGSLTGYGGHVSRKLLLLDHEARVAAGLQAADAGAVERDVVEP